MSTPTLRVHRPRSKNDPVRAVVLVLHGGRARSLARVWPFSLAVLRMVPFARSVYRAGQAHGVAVARLRFAVRGWNGSLRSPVGDAQWALTRLGEQFPGVPIGIIGHSMGGRTALAVAGEAGVVSVVALAPWVEPYDPVTAVTDRKLLVIHGSGDRMTSPAAAELFVEHAEPLARTATFVRVDGERHAMLRRPRLWHALSTAFTLTALLGVAPVETAEPEITNTVMAALEGAKLLTL